jgi:putative nucleotidyltransferase with HDIG domain
MTVAFQALLAVSAVAAACLLSSAEQWQPMLLVALLAALSIGSHLFPFETGNVRICGSFMSLVLAMALLGPAPAAAIGVAAVVVDGVFTRGDPRVFFGDIVAYAVFPLVGALMMEGIAGRADLPPGDIEYGFILIGVFMVVNALNFVLIIGPKLNFSPVGLVRAFWRTFVPMVPWELASAIVTALTACAYLIYGLGALTLLASMLFIFQYLLRAVVQAEERGFELQERMNQLSAMHEGMLAVMLKTLSLRDPMTARHSAAVARFSRALAKEAGLSTDDQELVHTAGLVHDIGKFIFPDSILTAARKLTEEEREIIKLHPARGAGIIRRVNGFERVADVVLSHHERIDGNGYPNGIPGNEIPILSRIISIADTYDVMTARDSYRRPVSQEEAIAELRRVSGTQLDAGLVELFVGLLDEQKLSFAHDDDADLEAELRVERRPYVLKPELAPA